MSEHRCNVGRYSPIFLYKLISYDRNIVCHEHLGKGFWKVKNNETAQLDLKSLTDSQVVASGLHLEYIFQMKKRGKSPFLKPFSTNILEMPFDDVLFYKLL